MEPIAVRTSPCCHSLHTIPTYTDEQERFVVSSGSTDGFEIYDFDYFTNYVEISAILATDGGTINISEVSANMRIN